MSNGEDEFHLSPPSRLTPGQSFADRYLVERSLGEGGMGAVYLVVDELLRERVALKLARGGARNHEAALRREVSLARRVTHPGVARVFELGVDNDVLYITMEFVPGKSLRQRLREGALPAKDVVEFGVQIASALATAHDAAVVHLDLKPDNILLVEDAVPRVVLVDFGISRRLGERARGAGTLSYMAPEQLGDGALGGAADVYALGLVLFELASGIRPFGDTPDALLRRLTEKPPLLTGVPAPLSSLIDACLEPRPADRPTMRVVEQTLARHAPGASSSFGQELRTSAGLPSLSTTVGLRLARARAALATGGDELRVLPELEDIATKNPTLDVAVATYALALVRAWNNALASDDVADRAVVAVSHAVAVAPHLADTHCADALIAEAGGDLAYAVRALRRALARDPLHAFSHEILGFIEIEAGVTDGQRLQMAHALDNAHRAGLVHIAREQFFAGDDAAGLALLEQVEAAGRSREAQLLRMRHAIWRRDRVRAQALADMLSDDQTPIGASIRAVSAAIAAGSDIDELRSLLETLLALPTSPARRAFLHVVFVEIMASVDADEACEHLLRGTRLPFGDLRWLDACPALAGLRGRPEFIVSRAAVQARCDAAFGNANSSSIGITAANEATRLNTRSRALELVDALGWSVVENQSVTHRDG